LKPKILINNNILISGFICIIIFSTTGYSWGFDCHYNLSKNSSILTPSRPANFWLAQTNNTHTPQQKEQGVLMIHCVWNPETNATALLEHVKINVFTIGGIDLEYPKIIDLLKGDKVHIEGKILQIKEYEVYNGSNKLDTCSNIDGTCSKLERKSLYEIYIDRKTNGVNPYDNKFYYFHVDSHEATPTSVPTTTITNIIHKSPGFEYPPVKKTVVINGKTHNPGDKDVRIGDLAVNRGNIIDIGGEIFSVGEGKNFENEDELIEFLNTHFDFSYLRDSSVSKATLASVSSPILSPAPTVRINNSQLPFPISDGVQREVKIPTLVYHHINDTTRNNFTVTPQNFKQQLQYLSENGYHPITLDALIYYLNKGQPLLNKPVILTFDDGNRDNYINAYPLLKEYGYVGTFFLVTDYIDGKYPGYFSWEQVKEMSRNGMEFGAHTCSHPNLTEQPADEVKRQISNSKNRIETKTGKNVHFFSYPGGHRNQQVIETLRVNNFWGSVTVNYGTLHSSQQPFELKRIGISGTDTLSSFIQKLQVKW